MRFNFQNTKKRNGQVVMISTVLIGGAMLAATAIAGFVLFYQLRQLNDAAQSSVAIYAADAGIENVLYCYYFQITSDTQTPEGCAHNDTVRYIDKAGVWSGGNANYTATLTCYADEARTQPIACNTKDPVTGDSPVIGFTVDSGGHTPRADRDLESFAYLR